MLLKNVAGHNATSLKEANKALDASDSCCVLLSVSQCVMADFGSTASGNVCWEMAHCCCSDCVNYKADSGFGPVTRLSDFYPPYPLSYI